MSERFGELALLRDALADRATPQRTKFLAALSANVDRGTAADALARGRIHAGSRSGPRAVAVHPNSPVTEDDGGEHAADTGQDAKGQPGAR